MTDITKCTNENCILRNKCFRFLATASKYQSYFIDMNQNVNTEKDCNSYWPVDDEEHLKELQRYWAD